MIKINDIPKFKLLILSVGLVIGAGIIAQPIVKNYVDCDSICESEKNDSHGESPTSDHDDQKTESSVTTLEAVNPAVQIDVSPTDLTTEEISVHENPARTKFAELIQKVSQKLFKVLFNQFISPNAP